jgi:hypothetical protein
MYCFQKKILTFCFVVSCAAEFDDDQLETTQAQHRTTRRETQKLSGLKIGDKFKKKDFQNEISVIENKKTQVRF